MPGLFLNAQTPFHEVACTAAAVKRLIGAKLSMRASRLFTQLLDVTANSGHDIVLPCLLVSTQEIGCVKALSCFGLRLGAVCYVHQRDINGL